MRKTTDEVRDAVIALTRIGQSASKIAETLDIADRTVFRIRKEHGRAADQIVEGDQHQLLVKDGCIITTIHEMYDTDTLRLLAFDGLVRVTLEMDGSMLSEEDEWEYLEPQRILDDQITKYVGRKFAAQEPVFNWVPFALVSRTATIAHHGTTKLCAAYEQLGNVLEGNQ